MNPLRYVAEASLAGIKGAFLRCDRGKALYVTNARMRTDRRIEWEKTGFVVQNERELTFLTPHPVWTDEFERWAGERVGKRRLTDSIENACFGDVFEEDMKLWIDGMKRLEMKGDAVEYEKLVRQRASVCLRERKGGGTLRACALIVDMMREGGIKDED